MMTFFNVPTCRLILAVFALFAMVNFIDSSPSPRPLLGLLSGYSSGRSRPRITASSQDSYHSTGAGGLTRVRDSQVTVDRRNQPRRGSGRMVFVPTSVTYDYGKPIRRQSELTVSKFY